MKKSCNIRMEERNKSKKVAVLDIYGAIEGDGYDWLSGKIIESETSATHIKKTLKEYGDVDRVELHINSMGGSVFEANAIANMLRRLDCETAAYIDAFACSAGSVIAVACKEVLMPRNAVMMIHNPWQWACGNAKELRKAADGLDVLGEAFRTIYLDKAGDKLDEKTLGKLLDAETYLTAEQAHEYGLCDTIEQFDAVLNEPDDDTKKAAAKNHIDLGKVCAMVRGQPLHARAKIPTVTPGEPEKEEPGKPEPDNQIKQEAPAPAIDVGAVLEKFIR